MKMVNKYYIETHFRDIIIFNYYLFMFYVLCDSNGPRAEGTKERRIYVIIYLFIYLLKNSQKWRRTIGGRWQWPSGYCGVYCAVKSEETRRVYLSCVAPRFHRNRIYHALELVNQNDASSTDVFSCALVIITSFFCLHVRTYVCIPVCNGKAYSFSSPN